jgi:hypothetical protein
VEVATNGSKHLYAALLVGAAVAITLVAALTAWAAQLGGGSWFPVLVPFGLVLLVPVAALVWLRVDQDIEEPFQVSNGLAWDSSPHLDCENSAHTARRVA